MVFFLFLTSSPLYQNCGRWSLVRVQRDEVSRAALPHSADLGSSPCVIVRALFPTRRARGSPRITPNCFLLGAGWLCVNSLSQPYSLSDPSVSQRYVRVILGK